MNRHRAVVARTISLFLLFVLPFSLCACYDTATRPDSMTKPTDTSGMDIPVMAGTDILTEQDTSTPKKRVALTFDDGPNHYDDRTKKYVDELEKYGFHATFFVVGYRIAGGDSVAYAVEKGNEIGIHGYTHEVYYDTCDKDDYQSELNNTAQAIHQQVPDYDIKMMRPIGGKISNQRVSSSPYSIILWSVDSSDWENKYYPGISDADAEARVNTIVNNVMSSVKDGDIILLHDIYESTYDATVIILKQLYEAGYEVVTVSELLGDNMQAGVMYSSAYN